MEGGPLLLFFGLLVIALKSLLYETLSLLQLLFSLLSSLGKFPGNGTAG